MVIAEMANSHEGDIEIAKKLVLAAAKAGADAIKFQKFTPDELAEPDHEYYSLYQKLQMSEKNWKELVNFAKRQKLKVFVDIFGIKSAKQISKFNIDGYKLHSSDVNNPKLLKFLSTSKKLVLVSVAGSLPNEIDNALKILKQTKKTIILMHGFQGYPTKLNELNLFRIPSLKKKFCLPVGIMDHLSGDSEMASIVPLVSLGFGISVIEKHITLNRCQKGLDYYSALNPDEFSQMVSLIRKTEKSFGNDSLEIFGNELKYRLVHKKNSIAKKAIPKGTVLSEKLFDFKRTKQKKQSVYSFDYTNQKSISTLSKGEILTSDKLDNKSPKIAAIIACRVGSERLYAKPLQRINQFSILELFIKQLQKSKLISEVVLAISNAPGNEVFIDFAINNNLKYVQGDDTDVLARLIAAAQYVNCDVVFRNTPDCPYMYWEGIDNILQNHILGKYDFSIMNDIPLGSGFEVINTKTLEISHLKGNDKHRSELASLYIFDHKHKFKINVQKPPKNLQRPDLRLTVDYPEDLQVARLIYSSLGKKGNPIKLSSIIKLLDSNPKISSINSNFVPGKAKLW